MKLDVLLGLQWGDEGKGKIVDVIAPRYDVVARFQGGPNAGHSLEFNNIRHVLHMIPSGIFHPEKINIIGNGVVIDPIIFSKEINELDKLGVQYLDTIIISKKAHLILPTHRILDAASEAAKGDTKIGSTLKGIGPAYMDKTGRNGLRVGDILDPGFNEIYRYLIKKHQQILSQYSFNYNLSEFEQGWMEGIERMRKFKIADTEHLVNGYLAANKTVLAEGAQGTMLDIDFGSYPFVTSSNTITAGACIGLGVPPNNVGNVIGIFKAYCTRVGGGPFPTELMDETGEKMRKTGNEYGSTTGRPRRCGWLDLVALRYAIMLNGVTEMTITKADVLSGFDTLNVCTAYKINGKETQEFPYSLDQSSLIPVYKTLKGWNQDLSNIEKYSDLPDELKNYIRFIEQETGVKVTMVSIGPDRKEILQKN